MSAAAELLLGKYRLVARLGEGGMGTVYQARDELLERDVAIKVLRPELVRQQALVERFRTEARALARLNHPRIAILHGLERDGDQLYMVMEYVPGETLESLVRRCGRLAWPRAAELCAEILEALDHAHDHGVVHRDIKPANVMLTPGGRVKVMDFGIARVAGRERHTRHGHAVGTPTYMAPEQLRGEEVDGRTDLYALGAVLFELVTGRMAFEAESDYRLMMMQLNDPPPLPSTVVPGVPGSMDAVVARAMAKSPAARYASAAAMRGALRDALRAAPSALRSRPTDDPPVTAERTPLVMPGTPPAETRLVTPEPGPVPAPGAPPAETRLVTPVPGPVPAPAAPTAETQLAGPAVAETRLGEAAPAETRLAGAVPGETRLAADAWGAPPESHDRASAVRHQHPSAAPRSPLSPRLRDWRSWAGVGAVLAIAAVGIRAVGDDGPVTPPPAAEPATVDSVPPRPGSLGASVAAAPGAQGGTSGSFDRGAGTAPPSLPAPSTGALPATLLGGASPDDPRPAPRETARPVGGGAREAPPSTPRPPRQAATSPADRPPAAGTSVPTPAPAPPAERAERPEPTPPPPPAAPTAAESRAAATEAATAFLVSLGAADAARIGQLLDGAAAADIVVLARERRLAGVEPGAVELQLDGSQATGSAAATVLWRTPFGARRRSPVRLALELHESGGRWQVRAARVVEAAGLR